jgi:hypothetical protein
MQHSAYFCEKNAHIASSYKIIDLDYPKQCSIEHHHDSAMWCIMQNNSSLLCGTALDQQIFFITSIRYFRALIRGIRVLLLMKIMKG